MRAVADFVTALTAVAFLALGIAAGVDWVRNRDGRRGILAAGLISLGLVAGLAQFTRLVTLSDTWSLVYTAAAIVLFMASGYCVLLFRDSFIPLPRWVRWGAALTSAAAAAIVIGVADSPFSSSTGWQTFIGLLLSVSWAVLVGEPIITFWSASRRLPRVQRQRMRSLGTAFAVLVLVLLASTVGGSAIRNPAVIVVTQLIALAMVPLIWVAISPPTWLRRQWRAREELELRRAVTDLLIFSPGRVPLAEKAISWAARAVGGSGAFLVDGDGGVLASTGLDEETIEEIRVAQSADGEASLFSLPGGRTAIATTMPLEAGPGLLAVLGGPFTPVFGSDEVLWLEAYASSVTAGLERARVTERLAAMERTKTQFLNLASHELRGPLTVIRGYVSMLESGALGPLNEDGARALQIMGVKATEMNGLVEQMLEAARLEEGRLELHVATHDLRDVVRSSVEQVRPLVDERHPLTVHVPDGPVPVEVDADRIQTIVTNLVDNAVKYSPQGGDVRIEVLDARLGPRVRIHDEGVGIDANDMPRLFTRFGRIATAATSHLPGTGLGLYLSRELARLHGGDITVESRPGQGSTFTLQLPTRAG